MLSGAVKDLPDLARAHGIRSPALLIVGEVAGLASRLQWFGRHIDGGQGDGQRAGRLRPPRRKGCAALKTA